MDFLRSLGIEINKKKKPGKLSGNNRKNSKSDKVKLTRRQIIMTSLKTLLVAFLTLGFVIGGILLGAGIGYITTSDPVTDSQLRQTSDATVFLDMNGKEILSLSSTDNKNVEWAEYDEIPENLINAVIATEDKRFREHSGFDIIRTGKAILELFQGSSGPGGSTITQQLVKNATGDDSTSIPRKVREIWRAYQLEQRYSKEEILTFYFNIIYMGYDCYGVKSAAHAYFNKDLKDLTLAECAYLAGMIKNPGRYNPLTDSGELAGIDRKNNVVLYLMQQQGMITTAEELGAAEETLNFNKEYYSQMSSSKRLSYFEEQVISEVRNDLMNDKGYSRAKANALIYGGGATIYTTVDPLVQDSVETVYSDINNFPYNANNPDLDPLYYVQSAMVIIDPATGHVRGLYGGSGEKTINFGLNRATQIHRQPGSTIKPILVYGPLLDKGDINLATAFDDKPVYLDPSNTSKYYPKNADNKYYGPMTVAYAIAQSTNTIPASVFNKKSTMEYCLDYLATVGIDRKTETYVSTALGGFSNGVSPMEMAAAYVPYANEGFYYTPTCYTKIVDSRGNIVIEHSSSSDKEKWGAKLVCNEPSTPSLMTEAMKQVITLGTAKGKINIKDNTGGTVDVAGKTGTTTGVSSTTKDNWFVGYTPSYVAATWYGFDDNQELQGADTSQSIVLWNKVMNQIHNNLSPVSFTYNNTEAKSICNYSGLLATEYCKNDPRGDQTVTLYFKKNALDTPTQTCTCHGQVIICKTSGHIAHSGCEETEVKNFLIRPAGLTYSQSAGAPVPLDVQYLTAKPNTECTVHIKIPENTDPTPGTPTPSSSTHQTPTPSAPSSTPANTPEPTPGIITNNNETDEP